MAKSDEAHEKVPAYAAPALEKGLDIIELMADEPNGLTISEIAQRLGRSISELFRVIVVMERRNWLQKEPGSDRYKVSYRVLDVAFRATPAQQLTLAAAPVMHEFSQATNQSCHLVVRSEARGLVVLRQENAGPSGFSMRLGAIIDLASSCSGHVLLAFTDKDLLGPILSTLADGDPEIIDKLSKRLDIVIRRGYEKQPSARVAGVTDISYPIFSREGSIIAALTVPYIMMIDGSQPHDLDATRAILAESTRRISFMLGWAG